MCDVLFLCLPHGASSENIERYRRLAPRIIDLSAIFACVRRNCTSAGTVTNITRRTLLQRRSMVLPELHRAELSEATWSAVPAVWRPPRFWAGPALSGRSGQPAIPLVVEAKVGSSAAGARRAQAAIIPTGVVRYAPSSQRDIAIRAELYPGTGCAGSAVVN